MSVFSPRIASIATRALNLALYCFRVVVIAPPSLDDSADILTYCLVQNSGSTITNRLSTSGFTYNVQGDLTGDGTHTYQWDAEGRLTSVDNGTTATYTYNALGWRVEKKLGSAYTEYLFGASGNRLGENNRSTWTESYVPLGYGHYAIYQNNATYFTHPNALGSTTMVTDYDGNVVQDKLFYPWGQDWQSIGTVYDERFAKLQRRDTETSFDPTPNRMFASVEGRWLSPDLHPPSVMDPQSFNRYSYVQDNPGGAVDPSGLFMHVPPDPFDPPDSPPDESFACAILGPDACWTPNFQLAWGVVGGDLAHSGGGGGGGVNAALLVAAQQRVAKDLDKPACAKDFKNVNKTINELNTGVQLKDEGELSFTIVNGQPKLTSPYSFANISGSTITVNSAFNWNNPNNPNNTPATLNGNPWTYRGLDAYGAYIGSVSNPVSVSAAQLLDYTLLHELAHYNGVRALGKVDSPACAQTLWKDCIE